MPIYKVIMMKTIREAHVAYVDAENTDYAYFWATGTAKESDFVFEELYDPDPYEDAFEHDQSELVDAAPDGVTPIYIKRCYDDSPSEVFDFGGPDAGWAAFFGWAQKCEVCAAKGTSDEVILARTNHEYADGTWKCVDWSHTRQCPDFENRIHVLVTEGAEDDDDFGGEDDA